MLKEANRKVLLGKQPEDIAMLQLQLQPKLAAKSCCSSSSSGSSGGGHDMQSVHTHVRHDWYRLYQYRHKVQLKATRASSKGGNNKANHRRVCPVVGCLHSAATVDDLRLHAREVHSELRTKAITRACV